MKISVIGYSGSGKSTLAHDLSIHYGINVLHLDTVHWLPGWQERERCDEISIVTSFLDNNTSWIIDGNYSKVCYKRRMEESDIIILMKFNRFKSLYRVIKRYLQYKGKSRYSMTEGCPEKIDTEFLTWVLYKGRTQKYRKLYNNVYDTYKDKTYVVTSQKHLDMLRSKLIKQTW